MTTSSPWSFFGSFDELCLQRGAAIPLVNFSLNINGMPRAVNENWQLFTVYY
jgi:hypothetical protein